MEKKRPVDLSKSRHISPSCGTRGNAHLEAIGWIDRYDREWFYKREQILAWDAAVNEIAANPEEAKSSALDFGGHKYLVVTQAMPRNIANDLARSVGGYLVCTETKEELLWVAELLKREQVRGCWSGLFKWDENPTPCWVNGAEYVSAPHTTPVQGEGHGRLDLDHPKRAKGLPIALVLDNLDLPPLPVIVEWDD